MVPLMATCIPNDLRLSNSRAKNAESGTMRWLGCRLTHTVRAATTLDATVAAQISRWLRRGVRPLPN